MSGVTFLTKEGFQKLRSELDNLKITGRQEAARAIAEARDKGDISENAEYEAAKDAQGMLEMRINELETALANAKIIDTNQIDTSRVAILSKVTIMNMTNKREVTYQLVSESEADLKEHKISIGSPIGMGLVGKSVGDIAEVKTPAGVVKFEIVNISI
jgi:transcription elongation factor GreA